MNRIFVLIGVCGIVSLLTLSALAQSIPDLNGVWQGPYTPDLTKALGKEPPFTRWQAEVRSVDHSKDPLPIAFRSAGIEKSNAVSDRSE
jgi:hypothetical protein